MDTAVAIVRTYLELSGYFVLSELPVRAPDKRGYHDVTDLDVVAVRFPHPPRGSPAPRWACCWAVTRSYARLTTAWTC
jgi:hypothetical protein